MKLLYTLFLILISLPTFAQTKFTYDAAGNRIKRENIGNALVSVDVKINLQGASRIGKALMSNDLQIYYSATSGLLPATDPYSGTVSYQNIGNPAGVAGAVVDWVRIEIRDATNPAVVLQSKDLLLKTNGSIVDVDGSLPKFVSQAAPVHLAVTHRNHVPVMSNKILSFSAGNVAYDFTTALNKAATLPGDPPQMIFINGKWCLWAGNADADPGISSTDYNKGYYANSKSLFDEYLGADCNMDGGVDATDLNIVYLANAKSPYSTIANYE